MKILYIPKQESPSILPIFTPKLHHKIQKGNSRDGTGIPYRGLFSKLYRIGIPCFSVISGVVLIREIFEIRGCFNLSRFLALTQPPPVAHP